MIRSQRLQAILYRRAVVFKRRLFSSSTSGTQKITSADSRLAGRQRFYKEVGVVSIPPPWADSTLDANEEEETMVSSPISAGVDGSDSASGVHRPTAGAGNSSVDWQHMLTPRRHPALLDKDSSSSTTTTVKSSFTDEWYGVTLDGRTMKTPMGQTLSLPSKKMAHAIAAEWNAQVTLLQPANMPLMTLACTVLDQASHHPDVYRKEALKFLRTDTTCFWADPMEDRVLHRRQEDAWKKMHQYVEETFDHHPSFALGANEAMMMTRKRGDQKPFAGLPHPPELMEQATDWVTSLDAWNLVALSSICTQAKSFIVGFYLLDQTTASSRPLPNLQDAVAASRVEEEFQIENWGLVEGGHDYDRLNCSIQLCSAQLFAKMIDLDS